MGFLLKLCVCVLCFAVIIGIPGILWLHCLPHGRRRDNRRRAASGASSIQTKIINRNCYANSLLVLCMPVSESLRSPLICPRKVMGCDVWPAPTPPDTKEAAAKGSPHASCRRGAMLEKGFRLAFSLPQEFHKCPTQPPRHPAPSSAPPAPAVLLPNAFLIMQRTLCCQKTMTLISRSL